MTENPSAFLMQFAKSKEEIKALKHNAPWVFPSYVALKNAEEAVRKANAELEVARKRWEET